MCWAVPPRCPPGYSGLSCEMCSSGFERVPGGLYLGTCAGCNCNGHASACDPISGHCLVRANGCWSHTISLSWFMKRMKSLTISPPAWYSLFKQQWCQSSSLILSKTVNLCFPNRCMWYEWPVCSPRHRVASTTQKGLSVTSVGLVTLGTRVEVAPMTASPATARTLRPHGGKVKHPLSL